MKITIYNSWKQLSRDSFEIILFGLSHELENEYAYTCYQNWYSITLLGFDFNFHLGRKT